MKIKGILEIMYIAYIAPFCLPVPIPAVNFCCMESIIGINVILLSSIINVGHKKSLYKPLNVPTILYKIIGSAKGMVNLQ